MPALKDLTGQRFGKLTVIERAANRGKRVFWKCQCDCGNFIEVRTDSLTGKGNDAHPSTRSCGCLAKENAIKIGHNNKGKYVKDLVGQRFGKLVVIKQNYDEEYKEKSHAIWECKCDCGKIVYIPSYHLIRGDNISCGCSHISQGELKIHNILKNNNIFFEREKTFYDCKFNNNYPARFDFYVEDKYIIEYDGSQHFGYNEDNGWNTKEHYEKVKEHDSIKNQWCKEHNIPLIRIPYTHLDNLCIEDLLLETTTFLVE